MPEHTVSEILTHEHSKAHLTDVNYMPPLFEAVPLGIQHVLAMFVGNVTPALIIASAINAPDEMRVFLFQSAMFVAGIATLVQTSVLGRSGLIPGAIVVSVLNLVLSGKEIIDHGDDVDVSH